MSHETEIPLGVHGQEVYLGETVDEIIRAAGDQPKMAEAAVRRFLNALAYNGSCYLDAAEIIIKSAGSLLGEELPEAGAILTQLGQDILDDKINRLAVTHFLAIKVELHPEVPEDDLPFYQMAPLDGWKKDRFKAWFLDLPKEAVAAIEKAEKLEEEAEKLKTKAKEALAQPEVRDAFRRIISSSLIIGYFPKEDDPNLEVLLGAMRLAKAANLDVDSIITALTSKGKRK